MIQNGIFCISGNESTLDLTPVLKFLEAHYNAPSFHTKINSIKSFESAIHTWTTNAFARYPILYIGLHGEPGKVEINGMPISLNYLGRLLKMNKSCFYVHLSSCNILQIEQDLINNFLVETGAVAISGFCKSVYPDHSDRIELSLLSRLCHKSLDRTTINNVYFEVENEFPMLLQKTGFALHIG